MVLTGDQLIEEGIIVGGIDYKMDDGNVPSYGLDGALYTFRADLIPAILTVRPGRLVTLKTFEHVAMPVNRIGYLFGKSTYTRQGLVLVSNTPVDPGYRGSLSMVFFNATTEPIDLNLWGGLMQMTVHRLTRHTAMPYEGRWQDG